MKANLSKKKRITKIIIGLVLMIGLYFVNPWLSLIGLIPILVGVTGFCLACYFLNRCSLNR
ncbi:MAG: DUF2892 domain-containing protein [Campylobacter sp.]|nr:DUF2892 domain-containing protein [Campylobacter sp.]MBQ7675345.1 DUF2892 domain-containing protein [Campylobacter sp.]